MEGNVQTEIGPMRPSELLDLVRKGDVKPDTKLRKDNSAWFPAKEVGGLFEAAVREEVRYYCPSCNVRISKPPITCPNCLRDLGKGEAREIVPKKMKDPVEEPPAAANAESTRSRQNWLTKKVNRKR